MEEILNDGDLRKATALIENTIVAAFEACYTSDEEWAHDAKKEILKAWKLLIQFGDLDDKEDTFAEFVHYYNENKKD